jgi:hypothetical protein
VRVIVVVEWADDELGSGARAPDKLRGSGELATSPRATQIEEPSRWITPDGQRFEVQFHTPESFHAKQHLTHWAYEQLRNTIENIARAERLELKAFQRHVASFMKTPGRAAEIPDFKEDQT